MEQPLAFKLRPTNIDEIVGQEHLVGRDGFIRRLIENKKIFSLILFGPPGTGKTTLSTVLCKQLELDYVLLNATINNKKDIEDAITEAKFRGHMVIIMDEVHRLNKDKQDLLLDYVESGLITLIGATTANPYHSINPAIRSRCQLIELKSLETKDIETILRRALTSKDGLDNKFTIDNEAITTIAKMSGGDVRYALNQLEICSLSCKNKHIDLETVNSITNVPQYLIDSDEDGHYDAVSALQKSIRGSDVDAALYYLARLIAANDLESIERRVTVTAYEDIGLANPNAILRWNQAMEAAKKVGYPECAIILGVAVVDLALSPKSKTGCLAIEKAMEFVESNPLPVPKYLRLSPVGLKDEEKYPYDRPDLWDKIQYLPEQIKDMRFYKGTDSSPYEKSLKDNNDKLHMTKRSADLKTLKKR